jgi:hypothetical protein
MSECIKFMSKATFIDHLQIGPIKSNSLGLII